MKKGYTIKVLDKGYVRYVDHFGSDERVVEAARISYLSPSKGTEQDKKLLNYLYKNMHSSPFEQCSITFNIKLPLFVQGQLVRHRMQRLNQCSARYTEMPDEFYIPEKWRKQDNKNKQGSIKDSDFPHDQFVDMLKSTCAENYRIYQRFIDCGVSREMARMVLPQNLYTEIYSNWDLNNLTRFFRLRLDYHAQLEIREYAKAMFDIFKEIFPWTAEAYEKYSWELVEKEK